MRNKLKQTRADKCQEFVEEFISEVNDVYQSMYPESKIDWDDPSTINVHVWNKIAAGDLFSHAADPRSDVHRMTLWLAADEPYNLMMTVLREPHGTLAKRVGGSPVLPF